MAVNSSFRDRFGLAPTTDSVAAAAHFEAGVERLLSQNLGAIEYLDRALAADPEFALAHAVRAFHALTAHGDAPAAKAGAERATALAGRATPQEQGLIAGYTAFIGGDPRRGLALLREHLDTYPRDTLAMSGWAPLMVLASGRRDRQEEMYAVMAAREYYYAGDWWFPGTFSFVCHGLHRYDESRRYAELALARHPRFAQATHSLSHVFYETNDHAGGRSFLNDWMPGYEREAPQFAHLKWHLALFELASGHYRRVMEIYAQDMEPTVMQARTTLVDTASLLWRLQLYGAADAPLPWEQVKAYADRTVPRPGMAFADAHVALVYAATGDAAAMQQLIDGLTALDAQGHPLAGSVVLPLARGIEAFSEGAYDEAIRQIAPITDDIVRIGGSNAQRQVFEDTLLQAYLRAERFDEAEALLRTRLGRRESARDQLWLGQAQQSQGRLAEAAASVRAARDGWRDADPDAPEIAALSKLERAVLRG